MEQSEIRRLLQAVDKGLSERIDVLIVGGAAMLLHFGANRSTRDIDMIVLRGDTHMLRASISTVAAQNNLPDDWMNDAVKGFADILPPDFYIRITLLDLGLVHLNVYALGMPDQAAMKIVAFRERDLEDLELLLPRFAKADKDVVIKIMHHVARFRPDWAQRMRYFLQEQGWQAD